MHTELPGIAPALRRKLAREMEDYRDRVAERIKRQRLSRGQDPIDVAYAIGVNVRTYERWESGERLPQLANFRRLAEEWGVQISDLRPDLEAEAEQLQRLEEKVDAMVETMEQLRKGVALVLAIHAKQLSNEAADRQAQELVSQLRAPAESQG